TIAISPTATAEDTSRAYARLQVLRPEGTTAWRSANVTTAAPTISPMEIVPTDQAIPETVRCFILGRFSSTPAEKGRRRTRALPATDPRAVRVLSPRHDRRRFAG